MRCAAAIRDALQALGVEIRSGLHTGEIELLGDDVGGLAVHVAARVAALAGPGEILSSGVIRDLVAGSGLAFADRGVHALKGLSEGTRIYAVTVPGDPDERRPEGPSRCVCLSLVQSLNRHVLGAYGGGEVATPNFDRLAERSVTFERHFVGSMPCMPARRDMQTGG